MVTLAASYVYASLLASFRMVRSLGGVARHVVPQAGEKLGDVADAPDGDVAIAAAAEGAAASEPGQEHGARALDGGRQHVPVVHEGPGSYAAGHEVSNVSPADGALI